MACFRFAVCAVGLLVGGSFAEPDSTVLSVQADGALATDDECYTAQGEGACALIALQKSARKPGSADDDELQTAADALPDESTGFDHAGPYLEEPSEDDADSPQPAKEGWENETSLLEAGWNSWGRSFCESHHVGYFCSGYTRVRCCQKTWGFVKCGSTVHSSGCGWHSVSPYSSAGSAWHIHRGWRQSSFCSSHHVGFFCYSHHKVHCCNDYGHYVDCTSRSQTNYRC